MEFRPKIFENTFPEKRWDGSFKGKISLQWGVYSSDKIYFIPTPGSLFQSYLYQSKTP